MERSLLHRSIHFLVVVLVGVAIGCSSSGGALPGAISQTVGPEGAEIQVTANGSKEIAGTTLLIPAGALDKETTITVAAAPAPIAAAGETGLGPTVRFEPDGLVFSKPATLTLPFVPTMQPAHTNLAIDFHSTAASGQYAAGSLVVDGQAGTVSVDIGHFTDYQVVAIAGKACQSNLDCPSGQACVASACATVPTDGGLVDGGGSDGGLVDGAASDGAPLDGGAVDLAAHDAPLHDASGTFDGGTDAALQYCTSDSQCPTGQYCVSNYCQ